MSIEDLRVLSPGTWVSTDVCVIGSGPAGFTLASELDSHGIGVVVLESGGHHPDDWTSSLNEVVSIGAQRVTDQWLVRNRLLGGSSATWGGRVTTFDAMDFREREWVPGSGWPITADALRPYFARAASRLGSIICDPTDPSVVAVAREHLPAVDSDELVPYVWSYSRHDSRRRDYMRHGALAQQNGFGSVRCYVHATVTQLEAEESGQQTRAVEVRGLDGQVRSVTARYVVVCAGGIENARLLLASNRTTAAGIGNERGLVGRFLMDHLRGPVAWFDPDDAIAAQRVFGDHLVKAKSLPDAVRAPDSAGTGQLTAGYALSPALQEKEELLNCALFVKDEPSADDPLDAALHLASLSDPVADAKRLLRYPSLTASMLGRPLLHHRFPLRLVSGLSLQCIVEQPPRPESRITLDVRTDALGMPLARVDWRVGEAEARTVRRATQLFVAAMREAGVPAPVPVPMIEDEACEFWMPDVAHPTGTTRMSRSPEDGVVDTDCKVHGVAGLYVVGSSVFPTSSHANPTQMIVTLAVRLADHLASNIRRTESAPDLSTEVRTVVTQPTAGESPLAEPPAVSPSEAPRILVSGASGRIGARTVDVLLREGFSVRALTSRIPSREIEGVEWRIHDLRQADLDFREDVRGCVGIVHLAAEQANVDDMYRANAEATGALAAAAESEAVPVMVYTSTMSVYGSPAAKSVTEDSPVLSVDRDVASEYWEGPGKRAYGRTKLQGELAIRATAKHVEYFVFRPTAVYAPADLVDMAGWTPRARVVLWKQRSHAINVDDVAEAIVWALQRALTRERPSPGVSIYNLSDESAAQTYGAIWQAFNDGIDPPPCGVPVALPVRLSWLLYWLWYRGRPRRLVGECAFPASKLEAEGYVNRHGHAPLIERAVEQARTKG